MNIYQSLLLLILFFQITCFADRIPKSIGHRIAESCLVNLAGCLPQRCPDPAKITITAPRFISLNEAAILKATVDKPGYSFNWKQIAGDSVAISNASSDTASFIATEVPQESPRFQVTATNSSCTITTDATVTPLETTVNPVFVSATYTGGNNDGSLEKPYTDIAIAYSAAPGAIYVAEGTYPIIGSINLINGHSIYGGFSSNFTRKVTLYVTTIEDTRSLNSAISLNTSTATFITRLDGLKILGAFNSDNTIYCYSGSPILSNLVIQARGNSPNSTTTVALGVGCSATLEKSKVYASVSGFYCTSVFIASNTVKIRYNEIYGIDGCGRAPYGISLNLSNYNLTDYNYIDAVGDGISAYSTGINVYNGSNITIANQNVSGGSGGSHIKIGISSYSTGIGVTIKNNIIYSGTVTGSADVIGIYLPALNSAPTRIENNTIYTTDRNGNISANSVIGIRIISDQANIITNNVVNNIASSRDNYGIIIDTANTSNSIVVNNTIRVSNSGTFTSYGIQLRGFANPIIVNNIIYSDSPTLGLGINERHTVSDPSRLENNLIFNMPTGLYNDEFTTLHTSITNVNSLADIPVIGNNMTTSPQTNYPLTSIFIDPANGDYRLRSDSPYNNAGKNLYNDPIYGSITTNKNGEARPSSGNWSIGAY